VNWITPITDRTAADITNRTPRGFLNASDINRIEGNIAWLANRMRLFNVFTTLTTVTNWNTTHVPVISDFVRIHNNLNILGQHVHALRPDVWIGLQFIHESRFHQLDFATVNLLETNIQRLKDMIERMPIIYRQASFISGQQLFLPQRRV